MGIGDLFKAKENESLRARVAELEAMVTPEMLDHDNICKKIKERTGELSNLDFEISTKKQELYSVGVQVDRVKSDLVETEDAVLLQSFGFYKPHYEFANSTQYKDALSEIRNKQKEMVKAGKATLCTTNWRVSDSEAKGRKMIKDISKLLLRAFNTECDDCIGSVKFHNIDSAEKRIRTVCKTISKLGQGSLDITISDAYLKLKIEELYLAYEYQTEKQKEKDALKMLKAEERERAKLEKEIQEARKRIEKEQKHYKNALGKIIHQIQNANPEEIEALEQKKAELEGTIVELDKSMEQIDYRAANQKAGYVYIISNIGAFGENVYKIGMTRRLEPMDRIDELGDASVPFDFDVHALIFSENAPALEAALHHAFEDRKLNMVNTRREFFSVTLDEIKEVVKNSYDKTVEFFDVPLAEQYRQSELIRNSK